MVFWRCSCKASWEQKGVKLHYILVFRHLEENKKLLKKKKSKESLQILSALCWPCNPEWLDMDLSYQTFSGSCLTWRHIRLEQSSKLTNRLYIQAGPQCICLLIVLRRRKDCNGISLWRVQPSDQEAS